MLFEQMQPFLTCLHRIFVSHYIVVLYLIIFSVSANIIGHNAFLHGLGSINLDEDKISSNIDNRIVGGTYASLGQFPYQV